jgi:hypothetical protein
LPADRLANWICRFVAAPEAFDLLAQQVNVTAIEFVTFEALVTHCTNRLGMSVSVVDFCRPCCLFARLRFGSPVKCR